METASMIIQGLFYLFTYMSIILCAYSALSKKPGFAYLAAFLAIPFCLYTAGAPAFFYLPLMLPPMIFLSGLSIKLGHPTIALLLSLPYLGFSIVTMIVVMFLQ
jgi:hypothetical protein